MNEIDELFTLHHLDLGLDDEEIEDLLEESTTESRFKWLKRNGYEVEEND